MQFASLHIRDHILTFYHSNRDFRRFLIENLKFMKFTQTIPMMVSPRETHMILKQAVKPKEFKVTSNYEILHLFGE